jgi:hypothetical protein
MDHSHMTMKLRRLKMLIGGAEMSLNDWTNRCSETKKSRWQAGQPKF